MVKPRKNLSLSDKCPQFFKVFLPERSSQRLRIPPAFLKHFDGVLPSKSIIRSLSSRSWRVEVKEVDNNLYFEKGWHEFVEDNSLELGDFLVFCYGGDSIFFVKVFGKNGCHKEVCIPTMEENQITETVKDEQLILENNGKQPKTNRTLHRRGLMAVQESDKSLKPPGKFLSSYPSFQVVMKKAYVDKTFMHIPLSFVMSYIKKGRRDAILRVSAKSWDVKLIRLTNGVYRISKGWRRFCNDNALQVGDVCVFELIERDDFVLKVSVSRSIN